MVKAGVADNNKSWLQELLCVLVSQCSWDPLSTEVVALGVSGELEHGSLGILTT